MKRLLLLSILLSFIGSLLAQPRIGAMCLYDRLGNKDSLIFGNHPSATLGIDLALNEIDESASPYAPCDIRSFMDPVMCSYYDNATGLHQYPVQWQTHLDLRDSAIQTLDPAFLTNRALRNSTYHLIINCVHPPCTMVMHWKNMLSTPFQNPPVDVISLAEDSYAGVGNCNATNLFGFYVGHSSYTTSTGHYMMYYFQNSTVSLPGLLQLGMVVQGHTLRLNEGSIAPTAVWLIDALGRELWHQSWQGEELEIPGQFTGLYYLRVANQDRVVNQKVWLD